MPDKPTSPSPFQITRRDLETVRYQNEPMRQASWTYPSTMLKGEDWPLVRQFALDTVMQMKQLYPDQFVGKTMQDWEQALVTFITTRRPEFRAQVLTQLKGRYGEGKAMDPDLVLTKAMEGFGKKAAAPPIKIMRSVMRKLVPNWEGFLASKRQARVREYRSELGNLDSYPATSAQRLESFKFWKRTGQVPAVSANLRTQKVTDVHSGVKPGGPGYDVHRPMLWSKSDEPVKIVHYGKGESVADVAKSPRRRLDRSYIVPGRLGAEAQGAYFGSPGVEFPGYGDKRLEVTVPLKAILRAPPGERQEAIFPRGSAGSVLGHRIEKKGASDVFMDEIAKISGGSIGKMQEQGTVAAMGSIAPTKKGAVPRKLGFVPTQGVIKS